MPKDTLHVVPHDEGWGVKREGNERFNSTHSTQKDAIEAARTAAHDGDDIVIHRADGTIRERVTYTLSASGNGNGNGRTPARPHDVVSVGSRVRWSAVLAGLAVAFTVYALLTMLSLAMGASTIDTVQNRTFAVGAALISIVCLLVALFLGGYVTSRMTTRETAGEAAVYGVLLWAAFFFTLLLTGMNLGGTLGQLAEVTQQARVDPAAQGISPAEAQRRRDAVQARGEQWVSEMNPVELSWWAFGGMAASILAAIGGAVAGSGPGLEFRRVFESQPEGRLAVRPT